MRTMLSTLFLTAALVWAAPAVAASPQADQAHGDDAEAVGHVPQINWLDLGYKDKDEHGGELEEDEQQMAAPLLMMLINFGLLLALLGWKAVPPLRRYAEKRHGTIKDALEEASRLREEARRKLDEYNEKIKDVETEIDELIEGIRADAEAEKKRILADAEKQAASLERAAEDRIAADIDRARTELEREVAAAAIAAAEKILRERVTSSDQTKLVEGFLAELEQEKPQTTRPGGPAR